MDFKELVNNLLVYSLHLLISLALLASLLLGVWIVTLYAAYYFSQDTSQQHEIFTYLLNNQHSSLLNVNYLSVMEKRHLLDVKRLFAGSVQLFQYCFLSCFGFMIIVKKHLMKHLLLLFIISLNLTLIATTLLLNSFIGFKHLFHLLHQPFFTKNTWLFTKESSLIKLFPIDYFYQYGLFYIVIISMIILLLSYLLFINKASI